MNERSYRRSILAAFMLLMAFLCLGQAITTEDLLRAGNSQDSGPIAAFAGNGAMNQPPSAKSLTPDKEGPQMAGTTIVWTGNAYDPDGDDLLYQFWLNGPLTGNIWKPMTNWNRNNTWNWTTGVVDAGNNIIDVRVRDGRHAAPWGSDSHVSTQYAIERIEDVYSGRRANYAPSLLSLKPDRPSPQDQGTRVTWTAKASDPDQDTILYQFMLKGPSTWDQWQPMTLWNTTNVWVWNTGQLKAGIYLVEVRTRDGYHAGEDGADDSTTSPFALKQKGIIK